MANSKTPKKEAKEKEKTPMTNGVSKPNGRIKDNNASSGGKTKTRTKENAKKKQNKVNGGAVAEEPEVYEISGSSTGDSEEEETGGEKIQKSNGRSKSRNGKSGGTPRKRRMDDDDDDDEEDGSGGGAEDSKTFRFPMNRIRRIMRSDKFDSHITQEAVFLVNKATEMFIERFSEDAYECSIQDKKKFIHYKHLSSVVSNEKRYEFLSDYVPEKVKAEDALEQWKAAMTDAG